jgi:peptide chain release factor 2
LNGKRSLASELEKQTFAPDFWQDQERAVGISKRLEDLKKELLLWETIANDVRALEEITAVAQQESDATLTDDLNKQYDKLNNQYKQLEFLVLFSGKYDESSAILSIHAGTGGVDAQDWSEMLERMYLRFAEKMGWRAEILDRNMGNEAGLKNNLIRIEGRWAYGYLKSEAGVHRLVRISPFDAEAMRQTSFALVEVIPELPDTEVVDIKEDDLEYDFFRSSGPGGQNVNKTSSAVRLTHKPSGIIVTCQTERSQHQNRERALAILKAKLVQRSLSEQSATMKGIKGGTTKAEWGRQIRSYVLDPYQLVKDHRTNEETSDIESVLDGNILPFIESYLRNEQKGKTELAIK